MVRVFSTRTTGNTAKKEEIICHSYEIFAASNGMVNIAQI
uniref:Uncharacterized protein n=1 Tax=Siphoviridae sp. ct2vX3 TaxID=2825318 RepID=A0A8S5PZ49_9CAUD|nr:MAG TPA: hypothetical protein [Siphoviridae sp. ct2vX3]